MKQYTEEQLYGAAFSSLPSIGPRRIRRLVSSIGSCKGAWHEKMEDHANTLGISLELARTLEGEKARFDWDALMAHLEKEDVHIVTYWDEAYPPLLKRSFDAPALLFYKGRLPSFEKSVAIVGARKASSYGINAARALAGELARCGVVIVSGGARGIDSCAHKGALSQHGCTVAVVANGLDLTYPPEHRRLFYDICEQGGAIVTEFYFGVPPLAQHFPSRNRIIAGIAPALAVVEAAVKSGSLITADFALEEGREVFALPGSIYSQTSKGTNKLIKEGATILTSASDILMAYDWAESDKGGEAKVWRLGLTRQEKAVYGLLSLEEPRSLEYLIEQSGLSAPSVSTTVLHLELQNLIYEVPGGYIRNKLISSSV